MSTTSAPPVAATPAGPVRQRVRGMARSWALYWAIIVGTQLALALEPRIGYFQSLAVMLGVGLVLAPVGLLARRREDDALGGRGQREMLETALSGARVPPDGDVPSWRRHLPVLHRRAEEAVLGMRWTWVAVLLSFVVVLLTGVAGYRSLTISLSAVPVLTVLAWPFLAVHLRRRRDRLDALAERLGRG